MFRTQHNTTTNKLKVVVCYFLDLASVETLSYWGNWEMLSKYSYCHYARPDLANYTPGFVGNWERSVFF